jgi:hypothetical protein
MSSTPAFGSNEPKRSQGVRWLHAYRAEPSCSVPRRRQPAHDSIDTQTIVLMEFFYF